MNVNISNFGVILAVIALVLAIVLAAVGQLSLPLAGMFGLVAVAIILK